MGHEQTDTAQLIHHTKLYKNHGAKIGYWEAWVEYPGTVVTQHASTLDGQAVRREYAAEPKNVGKANETSALEQAKREIDSKAMKKRDKGYVKSVGEAEAPATNSLNLQPPMLATPLEKVTLKAEDFHTAFVQPKLDGHRALFSEGVLYSRQGKALDLPHITQAIYDYGLDHLHLDGELYVHGKSLQDISKLVKKHRDGDDGTLSVEYHLYDIIENAPFHSRIVRLTRALSGMKGKGPLKAVPTRPVSALEEALDQHTAYRSQGYEGTMLRFGQENYRVGKRSRTLLKIKEFHDGEFEIIGVEEGKPLVTDLQTFRVPVWRLKTADGQLFNTLAQGNAHQRHQLWETREKHIGKLLTVKYHYLSKDGIPQLPIALRFREDV